MTKHMTVLNPKRLGIIGAGKIVEDGHLPILMSLNKLKVSWISDSNDERSKLLSKMYAVPHKTLDLAMKSLGDLDLCLIAIPVGARKPYIEACARAGIAIYVEKPFARTSEEHEYFCSLFPDHKIAVGLQRRFFYGTQVVKRIIEQGIFGKLRKIELNHGAYSLKSGGPNRYVTDPRLSGGGVIIESSIHCLDQILFCAGAKSLTVQSAEAVVFGGLDYESKVMSSLTADDGRVIEVLTQHTNLRNSENGFLFYFDTATITMGTLPDSLPVVKPLGSNVDMVGFSIGPSNDVSWALTSCQSLYLSWNCFLKGIEKRTVEMTSPKSMSLITAWIDDIYRLIFS